MGWGEGGREGGWGEGGSEGGRVGEREGGKEGDFLTPKYAIQHPYPQALLMNSTYACMHVIWSEPTYIASLRMQPICSHTCHS